MKKLVFLLMLIPVCVSAQVQLSDKAEISVVTCGPGQTELYSAFGHSAFRVFDPVNRIDSIYNYGVFDFDQPNFYLNFTRGYLYYKLGVHRYQDFRYYYEYFNRSIHEQQLNLTASQKQKLFDYLEWNALPENQFYRYDYFYDNCATKIRDVIVTVFGDSVTFDTSFITTDYSIRELTDLYLGQQPWGDLGIDVCLGLPIDKQASPYEYMFLPDYVESCFNHATIKSPSGNLPLVKDTRVVYSPVEEFPSDGLIKPLYLFSIIAFLVLLLSAWDFRRRKISTWFDYFLFGATGAVGLLLFVLWIATDHKAAANNLNILWALPTHLIAIVGMIRRSKWVKKYFFGVSVLMALLLLSWPVLPQMLHVALVPVVLILLIRSHVWYRIR